MSEPAFEPGLSAFVICQDEARVIEACLRSVEFADEIVVVDSGSTDGTLEIVRALAGEGLPIRLVEEPWRGYGGQKSFALSLCTREWCLSIDADERVTPHLRAALPGMLARGDVDGWKLVRWDYLLGYGFVPPKTHEKPNLRVFRNGRADFDEGDLVHEGLRLDGTVRVAPEGGLMHFAPLPMERKFDKENRYSSLKARMRARDGRPARPIKMIVSPWVYFLRGYLRQGLWRAGWAGYIQARKGAVYSFLTEAKRWEEEAVRRRPVEEPADVSEY